MGSGESSTFQALLWEVSNKVSAAVEMLREAKTRIDALSHEHVEMRERLARLEEDKVWKGEERREVKGRLETGDHTFLVIKEQAAEAQRLARQAFDQVGAIRNEIAEKTKLRAKHRWFFYEITFKTVLPHVVKAVIVVVLWLVYHFGFVVKMAESAKAHGGSP